MASLTNTKIKDTYDGLLKTTDNDALGGTYKLITDGLGNSSGVYLGTGGKVGIGTSSPSYPLDVNGEIRTSSRLWISTVDAISLTGSDLRFGYSNSNLLFRTNSSERLRIDSSGNVGIGTSSPLSKLHITNNSGGSGGYLKVTDAVYGGDVRFGMADGVDNDAVLGVWTNNNVKIYTNSTERMRIDSSGNFGFNATPENSSGTWRNYQLGSLSMAGRNNDSNPDAMFGTNFKFTTANAEQRISAHATSRLFFNDDVITFQNAASGAADSAISWSERMVIDSSGNVGIGTSSPSNGKLQIDSTGNQISIETGTSGDGRLQIGHFSNGTFIGTYGDDGGAADIIRFGTHSGDERMRIDSSGNVGIGTSIPERDFHLHRDTLPDIHITNSASGTTATDGVTLTLDSLDFLINNRESGNLRLFTSATERMRITSGGNLLVATTSSDGTITCTRNGNTYNFSATSDANNTTEGFFRGYSTAAGGNRIIIYSNGNIVNSNNSYGAISDAKLKENVTDASPKLDDLMQVQVRNFNYIGEDKKQIGVIAQELEDVFPSMIDDSTDFEEQEVTDEDGNVTKEKVNLGTTTKSVKYSVFVPILIKAIQELKAEIETLKSQINS
jgi:hypothetical protein